MTDHGTFGGEWRRPRQDGMGHSQKELQDRASYDNDPASGCGTLMIGFLLFVVLVLTGVAL